MGWILSREPQMSKQNADKVNEILASNGLEPSQFTTQTQDCGTLT